ncbi:cation diffusion facilitator family transporter [Streptosporangium saharense]|uniref:Cation diffusion facilitator family transporter n=1 Tax=Streptosporangium saharense TaxID=1706840 RepID=A0A7W7VM05_9ACTN|nr:cation diffusion facilitator family transporter [Streptosporangium saharense]MBB4915133.1 cation diffusion facilitator family transporter [Streptosporangium saharense]
MSDRNTPHEHGHGHGHGHGRLRTLLVRATHSHDSADRTDTALESSSQGMRVLGVSFAVLMVTAAAQAVIVALSGSVALLGDTLHNVADALTAVPLAIAFSLGRRAATRRFTYGYGRAEDLAGIVIVVVIALSAALAGYEAVRRLLAPENVQALGWVAVAGVVGFLGNEWVARYRIRVGRQIGSAALVADGLHARTDGFTSLAVLLSAGGAALGWRLADPVVGLLITAAICFVLRDAAREIYHRLMDAVDPALIEQAERIVGTVEGVRRVGSIRLRWVGHALRAEVDIVVGHELSLVRAHAVAVETEHRLIHELPRLRAATVHTDPDGPRGVDHHAVLSGHRGLAGGRVSLSTASRRRRSGRRS